MTKHDKELEELRETLNEINFSMSDIEQELHKLASPAPAEKVLFKNHLSTNSFSTRDLFEYVFFKEANRGQSLLGNAVFDASVDLFTANTAAAHA